MLGKKKRGGWAGMVEDGVGLVLTVSPPSPGSAVLRHSCCIVTLG